MTENSLARQIVDTAFRVHSAIGPGLFESVYETIMASELEKRGLHVARQKPMPVVYDGNVFEMGYRADLVVQEQVIVEVKSLVEIMPVHKKQLLTYLKLGNLRLGLLINFNVALI